MQLSNANFAGTQYYSSTLKAILFIKMRSKGLLENAADPTALIDFALRYYRPHKLNDYQDRLIITSEDCSIYNLKMWDLDMKELKYDRSIIVEEKRSGSGILIGCRALNTSISWTLLWGGCHCQRISFRRRLFV